MEVKQSGIIAALVCGVHTPLAQYNETFLQIKIELHLEIEAAE